MKAPGLKTAGRTLNLIKADSSPRPVAVCATYGAVGRERHAPAVMLAKDRITRAAESISIELGSARAAVPWTVRRSFAMTMPVYRPQAHVIRAGEGWRVPLVAPVTVNAPVMSPDIFPGMTAVTPAIADTINVSTRGVGFAEA